MWLSGCLLAAPTIPLFPLSLSLSPLPCAFSPIPHFFPAFMFLHSMHFFLQNHSLNKVYDNQNILAFLANCCTFWWFNWTALAKKKKKEGLCASAREKKDMDGRGEMLKNTEIWKRGKQKNGSSVTDSRGRNGAWREGEVQQKMRRREGGNAFWQTRVQDGFIVTSWMISEGSIDRRAVRLSLDAHVGEQAECSCAGTHAGSCSHSLWMHPKICTRSAHTHTLPPFFIFSPAPPSRFPFSSFCS